MRPRSLIFCIQTSKYELFRPITYEFKQTNLRIFSHNIWRAYSFQWLRHFTKVRARIHVKKGLLPVWLPSACIVTSSVLCCLTTVWS